MNKNLTEEYKDFILLHGDNLVQKTEQTVTAKTAMLLQF